MAIGIRFISADFFLKFFLSGLGYLTRHWTQSLWMFNKTANQGLLQTILLSKS